MKRKINAHVFDKIHTPAPPLECGVANIMTQCLRMLQSRRECLLTVLNTSYL